MNYQFGNRFHTESADRLYTSPSRHSDSRPRFQRNSPQSNQSNRTSPSRSSEESPVNQKFIKFNKISRVQLDPDDFFQGFSTELVRKEEEEDEVGSLNKYARSRENSLVQLKTLEREFTRREVELSDMKEENNRLKQALEKQIEKRRQAEKNLKNNTIMLSELQRKCRDLQLTITNLNKEIRFLEEKKYSKDERIQFSFREKGLLEEIKRLKAVQIANNNLQFLQRENRRLAVENQSIRDENSHLRIAQRTIVHRLVHFQKQLKVAIKLQEEFFELRHKYEQLCKKERQERKQLEKLKQHISVEATKSESLTFSSSSTSSFPKGFVRTNKYHSTPRRPNGS